MCKCVCVREEEIMQEKEMLEGRTTGWDESERWEGERGRGRVGYTSTPSSTSPLFSNNNGFKGAGKQEAVLNA